MTDVHSGSDQAGSERPAVLDLVIRIVGRTEGCPSLAFETWDLLVEANLVLVVPQVSNGPSPLSPRANRGIRDSLT